MKKLVSLIACVFFTASAAVSATENLYIMVPAGPGGGWDQLGRAVDENLKKAGLIKNSTIDNKAGAGGTIGLAQFVTSQKGGNALLIGGSVMVGAIETNKSPVTLDNVEPIARLTGEFDVLVVPADSPIKSVKELMDKLKKDPGSVSWGGGSAGGTDHILAALLAKKAGVPANKVNYIPFSGGGEAQAAILGGHVTVGLSGYSEFEGQIAAGKMRALAVSSPERLPGVNVPTLKEEGYDVVLANWRCVFAPATISKKDREAMLVMIDKMVKSPGWKETLKTKIWTDLYLAGDNFKKFLAAERKDIVEVLMEVGLIK